MKFLPFAALPFLLSNLAFAGQPSKSHHHHDSVQHSAKKQANPSPNGKHAALRKAKQAPPRHLFVRDVLNVGNPFLNSIFNVPSGIVDNLVGTAANLPLIGEAFARSPIDYSNGYSAQRGMEDTADRPRTIAETGFDVVEQLANGVAQKSRNALDRATSRASGLVDTSVSLGTSSLGAGLNAVREFQNEVKKIAGQAAGVAQGAMKAGEVAVVGAFDKMSNTMGQAVPYMDQQPNFLFPLGHHPYNIPA